MRVFISHSSKDKPAVEALALALRERGIDPWLDKWEIGAGDDIVASINAGLEEATAGVIVFSQHSKESRWVEAEVDYLTWARIQEGKALVPVIIGEDVWVPALLRPLARRGIEEIDAIADALLHRKAKPPAVRPPELGRVERVLITLQRETADGIRAAVVIGGQEHGAASWPELPHALLEAQATFLQGFRAGRHRFAGAEADIGELGRALRAFCLPGETAEALANLVDGSRVGTTIEVCFEAEDADLLGLPFEALRLPDERLIATHPSVVMFRRPAGLKADDAQPLAGPLKILVAVGAPDEGQTSAAVLDQERELQSILDAVEPAQRHENISVRILEVGHPEVIGEAVEADAYHVLHLSCHGRPGELELEDEEGRAVPTTAAQLLAPISSTGRPLPLVLLNACHGGVQVGQTASFADELLRAGVPCVLAMQTSVSDFYATQLARAFYEHLVRREPPLASRALAEARRELEHTRLAAVQRNAPLAEVQPEYATASLYVAGEERSLADFALDKEPLRIRPVYQVSGPVPQLRIDDLIGRRKELREALRTLRDETGQHAGVVLTGIGGVGKSAVAGRAMQRLAEGGWLVPAHAGRFDLARIALVIGVALFASDREQGRRLGELLTKPDLDDRVRLQLVAQALAEEPVVLVLDDFEQNLVPGGGAFLDADTEVYLRALAERARRGRLLITCRHPVPGADAFLRRIPIGPLSLAESRKMLLRLPRLRDRDPAELALVLRVIGGHPRMLEFLDALLRGGKGRLPHVTQKLEKVAAEQGLDPEGMTGELEESLHAALLLGARDVFLKELLDLTRDEGIDEVLLQAATSNLPIEPAGLVRMLAGETGDTSAVERTLERLEDLSLVHRFPDGSVWVHRWTAEGLARLGDPVTNRVRHGRAGRYRWWRVEHESHSLEDAWEAVRNFLAGEDFNAAVPTAHACFDALRRLHQSMGIAALASEVLETLPETHSGYAPVADEEARVHLALGFSDRALSRYEQLLNRQERLAQAEPKRADHQRLLSVSYERVGHLYRALGQGEAARQAYLKQLAIAERLAQAEPERADYQHDLLGSYQRVGDLYRDLGQGEPARQAYLKLLTIAERLAQAEPEQAEYQRALSVSYERMGDLNRALGQTEPARQAFLKSLAIAGRLAEAEPDADYQRHLSVSYNKIGDLYRDLGQTEAARQAYLNSLAIRERLVEAEPDRADYQSYLSLSYSRVGDVYSDLGQGEPARQAYLKSLAILERLVEAEPGRADYQRQVSTAYSKVGDLYRAMGHGEPARQAHLKSLAILERLVEAEAERADYQRDLSAVYNRLGDLYRDSGHPVEAREYYLKDLAIAERLAQAEPERADYQSDLVISLVRIGTADGSGRGHLERALSILETMKACGQLLPPDEAMLSRLRELLGERS